MGWGVEEMGWGIGMRGDGMGVWGAKVGGGGCKTELQCRGGGVEELGQFRS